MLTRAVAVWLLLMVLAIFNGAVRGAVLIPRLGEARAHVASTVILCLVILLVASLSIKWIGPATPGEAWMIGATWLILTLAFEFLAGHYVFGQPWSRLLADYRLSEGRVWVLVLVITAAAPALALWTRAHTR